MPAIFYALFILFHLICRIPVSDASHFRGGTISWKPNPDSSLKVDFKFRLAFRRSYSGSYYCDSSTVNRQGIIGWGGTWLAESQGYSYNIADTGFHCTSFSTYEDWSSGENSFNYTFPHAGPWVVRYSDCCWIALVTSSGDNWSLSTSVDLRRRKDTGKINSSPVSASSPVFRLQSGCPQVIKIPVGDPDGDVVRCRWSSGSTECGGMCNSFRHADLDEISCTLRYRGNGGLGFYGVAITLEDFAYGTKDFKNARPFSQVGLQFLVQIVSSGGPCNRIPFFTGSTPSDGACVELAIGSTYRASLVAQPMDSSRRIVEISTVSPVGINLTSLRSYYNQQNELLYRREVTWSPTSADSGQHIFCFKAIGQNGAESKSRCINFLVGSNSTPEVILSTRSPTYPTVMKGPGHISWNISFSHPIKRPRNSKFIRFHLNDKEIYKIDTSSGANVTISNNTVLHFKTPYPVLSMRGRYFITMDTGAVVGFGCSRDGPPTPGISDSRAWSFYTNGVCRSGFYLGPDLYTCIDVDECQRPSIRRKRSLARDSNGDGPESVISRKRRAAGCPSSLRWYSGSFSSPNFPNNYDNYESCSWGITVPSGYKVRLEFHTFNTESCCDFLRIYDGPSSSSPRVAEISGYQAPCVYHSSGRSLWFYFHTDHSGTYQGFYATYAAVPTYGSHVYSSYSSSVSNSWSINPQSVSIPDWHYQCVPFTPSSKVLSYSSTASISWSSSDIHPSNTLHMPSSAASVNRGCPSSVSVWYSGSFYSPFFPNSYQSYWRWRCSWVITVPRGYHLKLKFHTLDLGSYWDSLEIRDGSSRYSPQIGYFSGLYSGCVIYSTGRSLWFYFRTGSYGSGGQGFYATYSPVPENSYMGQSSVIYPYSSSQCMRATSSALYPAVSTTNPWSSSDIQPSRTSFVSAATASVHQGCPYSESGEYSGSFSFYYPVYWGLRCSWTISVPVGYHVKLEFQTFHLGSYGSDYLEIYDGPSSYSPRIGYYSGHYSRFAVYSTSRSLSFYFRSYGGPGRGFYATYTAVIDRSTAKPWPSSDIQPSRTSFVSSSTASVNQGCPYSKSGQYSGSFSSPYSYPKRWSGRCSWTISVPVGYHVKLEFHTLDLGWYDYDYLQMYDGPSRYSPRIGYYTGQYLGCIIYSSGRWLSFYFFAYGWGAAGRGFHATYTAVADSYSSHSVLSGVLPSLSSSQQCMRVTSMASSSAPISSSISPSPTSRVVLVASTASVSGCPYSESGQYSGSFSFYYPVYWGLRCSWTISVPVGYHVKLEFQTFHLGSYGSDYLEIYDGPSRYSPRIGYYSGRYYSRFAVYSTGRSLSFYFRAYGGSGRGFYATYTAVVDRSTAKPWPSSDIQPSRTSFVSSSTASVNQGCPYSKSGQYSGSFSSPYSYPKRWRGRCSWTILVPVGYHVKLAFHTLDLGSNYWDYLEIYDGPSYYYPKIGYYTGQYSGCVVYSSGRWLSFFFRANGYGTAGRGFHATYTAVVDSYSIHGGLSGVLPSMSWSQQCTRASSSMVVLSAPISSFISPSPTSRVVLVASTASASGSCSRSLFGYYGSFGSPNFPHNYPDNQDCVWSISVPYGYYVSLEFRSFSLEGGNKCPYDFVEIRDGYSSAGRLLGKFCDSGLPPKIASSGSYMRVQFRSDKSQSSRGFSANFVAISGASRPSIQPTNASRFPTMHSTRVPSPTPASGPFVLRLPANCEHSCDNYYGSYKCTCRSGYTLNSDNGTCHDIDECAQNNGGCSHSCVNFAGGHYCACLQGQTMMSDNRTCVEPGISVECGDETMQITLERKHFSHFQLKRFHLRYRNCQATGLNQTHMSFKTLLNDCGTSFNETKDELFYWNEVQVDFVAVGGVISRMHEVSIPFYCVYSKKKLVSGVSYKPRKVVFAPEAGYGNMTFTIDLYTSSSYQHPYGAKDYPINVKLNSDLYVGYKVLSNKGSLEVFAENCWATPQPSPYSTPYYTFLRSGCLLDMSMSDGNFSSSLKYFTIKAFRFFNFLNGYSTVYLHCELMACHVHTANSRCSRGCERFRRKKRETRDFESPESESSKKYKLSLGPISKQPGDGGKNEKAEGSGASYQVALVGGTVAAAALALVIAIALAVLTAKYRLVRRLMNRNKVGDMYAEENSSKNNYAMEQDVEEDKQAEAEC